MEHYTLDTSLGRQEASSVPSLWIDGTQTSFNLGVLGTKGVTPGENQLPNAVLHWGGLEWKPVRRIGRETQGEGNRSKAAKGVPMTISLQQAAEICLPPPSCLGRCSPLALRPERLVQSATLVPVASESEEQWTRALQQIRLCMGRAKIDSLARLSCGSWFVSESKARYVLQAVAAILYDQGCGGGSGTEVQPAAGLVQPDCKDLGWDAISMLACLELILQQMLQIDYGIMATPVRNVFVRAVFGLLVRSSDGPGFGRFCKFVVDFVGYCKQGGRFPSREACRTLADLLDRGPGTRGLVPDIAIMLSYYHTHSRPVTAEAFSKTGLTGYTGGVLEELIREIPTRGPARLARKLSVDVNDIIPMCVMNGADRSAMIAAAEAIAAKHGIPLYASTPAGDRLGSTTPAPAANQGPLPQSKVDLLD